MCYDIYDEYTFLEYLLDNRLLGDKYSMANCNDVPFELIAPLKDVYYDLYKDYCNKNHLISETL